MSDDLFEKKEDYHLPEEVTKLFKDDFLKSLKKNIEIIFECDLSEEKTFFVWFSTLRFDTQGFYKAFIKTCEEFSIKDILEEHLSGLEWYEDESVMSDVDDLLEDYIKRTNPHIDYDKYCDEYCNEYYNEYSEETDF